MLVAVLRESNKSESHARVSECIRQTGAAMALFQKMREAGTNAGRQPNRTYIALTSMIVSTQVAV